MISEKEVKKVAKLARLGLTEKEIKKFKKELSSILDYMEKLKKVDISKVKPTSHSLLVENVIREDEAKVENMEVRKKIIKMAPEVNKGYIKVKSIFS
mgnify:CR=1 FL=1